MNRRVKTITFIVTKDCQLACKYCYLVAKTDKERMSWDTAKAIVDYILSHREFFPEDEVIWEFIGGEPFLEIDLIDMICDYIKIQMYEMNHPWFDAYRFHFTTNGINYNSDKVQHFIKKNSRHLSICITLDGTKEKHDMNRIWKNSQKGSYDSIITNIPLWLKQFRGTSTKVTISSPDIPLIKDSVLHLYSLGIQDVNINVVFENVWKEGDDLLFEQQLTDLADAIIDNNLFIVNRCSFFKKDIGRPVTDLSSNWCGTGKMISIDAAGNFYPCTRFAQYSLREKKAWVIGSLKEGIIKNRLRPFLTLDALTQSDEECLKCEVASGCAWCQGENYDAAQTETLYKRSKAICKMHKARVRANNYYWSKLYKKLSKEPHLQYSDNHDIFSTSIEVI